MPEARIYNLKGFEKTDFPLLARLQINGSYITQAAISAIKAYVRRYNKSTGVVSTSLEETTLDKTSVVFDTLQTDGRWTKDATGYNFRYTVPAEAFPGPDEYEVLVLFTPTAGGSAFPLVAKVTALSLQGVV